jgi:uncharacterized protein (TIGR03437 family)
MKRVLFLALVIVLSASLSLTAAPAISANGVKNTASYADPGFPNGSIAQGSIFAIFGSGMGPAAIQYASSFPIPTTLSGTTVSVTVSGTTVQCPIIFTLAGQIAAILPSTTPLGTGTIVVSYNNTPSPSAPITVVAHSLGLFTVNQQGTGPGVIQDGSGKSNSLTNAFAPGQQVVFWGTGLGPITGSDANQPVQGNLPGITVAAYVGGKSATVAYAGRSLDAGDDQINVILPAGVTGCYVPVYFTVTGSNGVSVTSNFVTIAISSSGTTCTDPSYPTGLTSGTGYRSGSVSLGRSVTNISSGGFSIAGTTDSGSGAFYAYTPTYLTSASGYFYDIVVGSCMVLEYSSGNVIPTNLPTVLDAGPVLNVNGPNGAKQLTKTQGIYSATFGQNQVITPPIQGAPAPTPLYLDPGTYTIDNGNGGNDVGPFKLTLAVPPTFTWTNQNSITNIDRTQPLTITWTGGNPSSMVIVTGTSITADNAFQTFICYAQDSALSLTVPPAILSLLPPSATIGGTPSGVLTVETSNSVTGSAPGLDILTGSDSTSYVKNGFAFK